MSRYSPQTEPTVSTEGIGDIFKAIGEAISNARARFKRSMAIGAISFKPGYMPEVNGIPAKNYQMLVSMIRQHSESGQPWDLTINAHVDSVQETGDWAGYDKNNKPTYYSGEHVAIYKVIVLFGTGHEVTVRLPGYGGGSDVRSAILSYVAAESGGLTFKYY